MSSAYRPPLPREVVVRPPDSNSKWVAINHDTGSVLESTSLASLLRTADVKTALPGALTIKLEERVRSVTHGAPR